jgi:hypothetical protein
MRRFFSILLLLSASFSELSAQLDMAASGSPAADTGLRVKPRVQSWESYLLQPNKFQTLDTALDFVHRYAPLTQTEHAWQDLGHAGAPAKNLIPSAIQPAGLRSGFDAYRMLLRPGMNLVYNASNPYSRFQYTQGSQGLIGLQALHTQNITPGWNTTIDYHSLQSQGLYEHSSHKQRNVQAASHYAAPNGRYLNRITTTWNRFERNEHWGVRDTARLFSQQPSIFLPRNESANSSYFQSHHEVHQHYKLADSGLFSGLSLVHRMRYTRERFEYQDQNSPDSFYGPFNFYQMQGCADSFYLREAATEAGFMLQQQQQTKPWNLLVLGGISHIRAGAYRAVPGNYHNSWVKTSLSYGLPENNASNAQVNAIQYFSGYNAGDYLVDARATLVKENRFSGFQYVAQRNRAGFTDQFYFSKHFSWNNAFNSVRTAEWRLRAGLSLANHLLEVYYRSGSVRDLVYMNSALNMTQAKDAVTFGDLAINTRSAWRHFYLNNHIHFMGSSNTTVLPVPQWSGTHSLGYKGLWFNGVLRIRTGVDVWWYSRFNGYGYHPATGRFYVQQNKFGAYPLVDFFVNGEVKNLQFYVKMEHLNQGLYPLSNEVPYWSAAGYAFEPRRFRLGLRWGFFN